MKTLKLLYIDVPFLGFNGGDKNRSKFLYKSLLQNYNTDILLVKNGDYSKQEILSHKKENKIFTINTIKQDFYKASAIYNFDTKELENFKNTLLENEYDICFFRFASTSKLADFVKKTLPSCKIIIDVDMLFSQISKEAWNQNKSLKNRYHFFEYQKLSFFEKQLFNKNYNFLYTNKNELELVKNKYKVSNDDNHFVLPNVINEINTKEDERINEKYILFYGVLNSTANISAYKYLVEKIYPLLKSFLISSDIKIYIVGKNATKLHKQKYENIELIGEVSDVTKYIKNSLLVLFPLTIASGTLTRILEVAYLKKSIVATSRAANGLDLEGKIFIANKEEEIVKDILTICQDEKIKEKYENIAYDFVQENYSVLKVEEKMNKIIKTLINKKNILHIPRRFTTSHWGGTENVVLSIANGLKKYGMNSKIVTTNILCDKYDDEINSIKIKRFNYFYPYFNLSNESKTSLDLVGGNLFSWSMLYYLFFQKNIDLIHLHTAKRMGSIARFICKIKKIPYIVTIHGGVYDVCDDETRNRMKPTKNSFEWGKVLGLLFGSRKVYDDANSIITLNKNEYESIKQNYPNKDIHLLPNSINVSNFRIQKDSTFRKRHNIEEDKFVFLISARIDRQKNQLLVLKALKKLLPTHTNIHLLIVGNITDSSYFNELNDYIKNQELQTNVTIITDLKPNSKELINAYINSNSFILPSRHEPFGIVGLEAWASSLPLIISNVSGMCNIIEDKQNALVFTDNDKESLLSKMNEIISNKDLRNKLISNANKEVEKYDHNIVNHTLFEIYKNVMV
ncbi:glycosyltransferase [Poseidonibacter sp.]|uniref:glycosyltransferase n=1 Tax=Poseidonibacter sp. TaxID=2321188 RepID=UPI003C77CE54